MNHAGHRSPDAPKSAQIVIQARRLNEEQRLPFQTWSGLTLEWSRGGSPYGTSMFPFTVDGCSEPASEPEPVPGCDVLVAIPSSAVGANFVADAAVYWKPGEIAEHVLTAGTTVRAIGKDATGEYYQVLYVCDFLWVKAETLGPNYNAPWNGAPLPTVVVE